MKPFKVASDKIAAGGKYIYAPNETGNFYTPGITIATYPVDILVKGDYVYGGVFLRLRGKMIHSLSKWIRGKIIIGVSKLLSTGIGNQ